MPPNVLRSLLSLAGVGLTLALSPCQASALPRPGHGLAAGGLHDRFAALRGGRHAAHRDRVARNRAGASRHADDDEKPTKRHKPRKDRDTVADKPPHKDNRGNAQTNRPPRVACIGGRIRDGACTCRDGTAARRLGALTSFVCKPTHVARHGHDGRRLLAAAALGSGAVAAGAAAAQSPPTINPPEPPGTPRLGATPLDAEAVPNEVLFWIDDALPQSTEEGIARRQRLQILSRTKSPLVGRRFVHLRVRDGRSVADVLAALAGEPRIRAPQANYVYRQQDSGLSHGTTQIQYALDRMELPSARRLATGRGAVVAVIDTGIERRHPDLAAADIREYDTVETKDDDRAHGTALAGIIVGRGTTEGVAPEARLLAVRAFTGANDDRGPIGTTVSVIRALDIAVTNGAKVLNLSFAGPRDPSVEKAVATALARDIIVVAAAGNSGRGSPASYPAAYSGVIAVAATDADDRLYPRSSTGAYVAVAAPGGDVLVPAPGGLHELKSGTSFAAAHVSGIVALLVETTPRLSPRAARRHLVTGAVDLGAPGVDEEFGAGRVNAAAALGIDVSAAR